jgi:hypothetical protein
MPLPLETLVFLLIALVVVILSLWHHARVTNKRIPDRRPLPALDVLRSAFGRGAETGRAIHFSPGAGTIGAGTGNRITAAETIAGLQAAERVMGEAALNGAPLLLSSGDAVSYLALRGTLRQAYQRAGQIQDFDAGRVQLLAHQNETAYAAGVATLYARQKFEASALIGSFSQEFLLLSEEGRQREVPQLAGAAAPSAIPLMLISTDATLIGEEIYAAEAYLAKTAAPSARLMTQDTLRTVVIVLIVAGLVYNIVQPALGLPALPGL